MSPQPILIDGQWRPAKATGTFRAENPVTGETLSDEYPISTWPDCDRALESAAEAAALMRNLSGAQLAEFLEACAQNIMQRQQSLVEMAHAETGLPASPRLADIELPRTADQLRQAATAARDGSWAMPTIDSQLNIRSYFAPIGPVGVFGPNNFPFAFGSISGGDFAAAIAAGNPVIAKANSSHPGTTRLFAEAALQAERDCDMPTGTVQLLYRLDHADGQRLVAAPRLGATAYTGSRAAGLKLKAAADAAGRPIYLELSSVNPVVILPGALEERMEAIADEFTTSCLMGTGQFCTNPGLIMLLQNDRTNAFLDGLRARFTDAGVGTLLSKRVASSLRQSIDILTAAGAEVVVGVPSAATPDCGCPNTLLHVSGRQFLSDPKTMQTEAFGNASLAVIFQNLAQMCGAVRQLEGNLTGCIYSHTQGNDDVSYNQIAPLLRDRVGRLLNDKMPTGVAVSSAMNHGGPYPATGHPGFTAVGIPASLRRFAALQCFDNVRDHRLPECLKDRNPTGTMWRFIDCQWSQDDVS